MTRNEIGRIVVDRSLKVHKTLGPGLLESTYQECLLYELHKSGLFVEKEKVMPVLYDNLKLDCGYRIDLLIEGKVIVELKSEESLTNIHLAQILTYMKLSNVKLGFLINFNVRLIKDGIRRVVNKFEQH